MSPLTKLTEEEKVHLPAAVFVKMLEGLVKILITFEPVSMHSCSNELYVVY